MAHKRTELSQAIARGGATRVRRGIPWFPLLLLTALLFTALCVGANASGKSSIGSSNRSVPISASIGRATWYGYSPDLDGHPTASGIIYNPNRPHIAVPLWPGTTIPAIPLGTVLSVCAGQNPATSSDMAFWVIRCVSAVSTDTSDDSVTLQPKPPNVPSPAPSIHPGQISWYGLVPNLRTTPSAWSCVQALCGNAMSNGEIYSPWRAAIASPLWPGTLALVIPLGTWVSVCTLPWRCVTAQVVDVCPGCQVHWPWVWIDLSPALYRVLAPLPTGIARAAIYIHAGEPSYRPGSLGLLRGLP